MNHADFRNLVRGELGSLFGEKGRVLYSSIYSIKEWNLYVLGLDPGGTPEAAHSIQYDVDREEMNMKGWCALLREQWKRYRPGEQPYQRGAVKAIQLLGYDPRDVLVTNAIFSARPCADALRDQPNFEEWERVCKAVHEGLLEEVRPKAILCLGASEGLSAFSLMKKWANKTYRPDDPDGEEGRASASRGKFGRVRFPFLEKDIYLVGIKHPSWIRGPRLPDEMERRLKDFRAILSS